MEKTPFNREQELQILKAFEEMDKDLGVDKLDDEASLNRIFRKYPNTLPASSAQQSVDWLDRLGFGWVTRIGESLASPMYVYASFVLILSLVSVTAFQASQFDSQTKAADPLRGSEVVFQIVDEPIKSAAALANRLVIEQIPTEIIFESDGIVKIKIPFNDKTMILMEERRIQAPNADHFVLVFRRPE